jgi:uncharacterized protein
VSAYLDASVLLPRLVEEPESPAVDAYLAHNRQPLVISDFASAEVASGLSRLVRMRRLSAEEAFSALGDFEIWRAASTSAEEVHAADVRLAYALVRRFDLMLRAPDALHVAIAHRLNATLVTLDQRLANAARQLRNAVAVPETDTARNPR